MPTHSSSTPSEQQPPTPVGLADGSPYPLLDVGGPTVRPLVLGQIAILRGTIPPGRFVPLHVHTSHSETFVIESGAMEGIISAEPSERDWTPYSAGDVVYVPPNIMHGWRNVTEEPVVAIIVGGAPLANFFLEVGRPVDGPLDARWPPDQAMSAAALEASVRWDAVSASPEQNGAVGLPLG